MKKDTKFKPGQSGNPAGRKKKGSAFADILNEIGNELTEDKISKKIALMKRMYQLGLSGDLPAARFIVERVDGKPLQTITVESDSMETLVNKISELDLEELRKMVK